MRNSADWPVDYDNAELDDTITRLARRTLAEFAELEEIELTPVKSMYAPESSDDDGDPEITGFDCP